MSFGQKALSFWKGTTQTFTNISVAPGVFNKNLKMFYSNAEDIDGADPSQSLLPRDLNNDKKNKHQLFVTTLYNKAIMLHLSP